MTDWILVVLTCVYVVTTVGILISNNRTADATRKQVKELQRQFQEQNRPYVCIRFEDVRGGLMCLSIENTGNTPARDIRVSINEAFISTVPNDTMRERLRELTGAAIHLSPKQKLYCSIGGPSDFGVLKDQPLHVDVTYSGNNCCEYSEHIEIDVDAYGWALVYESPLGDIASHVKSISENIGKIQKKLQ